MKNNKKFSLVSQLNRNNQIVPKIKAEHIIRLLYKIGVVDKHGKKRQILLYLKDTGVDWDSLFFNAKERTITLQFGQDYDFALKIKEGASLHIQVFLKNGYVLCHIDNHDPDIAPLKHLFVDTNAKYGIIMRLFFSALVSKNATEFFTFFGLSTVVAVSSTKFSKDVYIFGRYSYSANGWKIIKLPT